MFELIVLAIMIFLLASALYIRMSKSYSKSYCVAAMNRRNKKITLGTIMALLILDRSFLALYLYRINHRLNSPVLGRLLTSIGYFLTGIEIYYNAKIGYRVQIWHGQGTVIGQNAVIGDDCLILHQVTLGSGFVTLESGVKVGAGAKILGNLTVGHDSVVGANSVVTRSLPPRALVKLNNSISSIDEDSSIVFGTR